MRDLKHIHFYEDLLEQANNDLVKKARYEGKTRKEVVLRVVSVSKR